MVYNLLTKRIANQEHKAALQIAPKCDLPQMGVAHHGLPVVPTVDNLVMLDHLGLS